MEGQRWLTCSIPSPTWGRTVHAIRSGMKIQFLVGIRPDVSELFLHSVWQLESVCSWGSQSSPVSNLTCFHLHGASIREVGTPRPQIDPLWWWESRYWSPCRLDNRHKSVWQNKAEHPLWQQGKLGLSAFMSSPQQTIFLPLSSVCYGWAVGRLYCPLAMAWIHCLLLFFIFIWGVIFVILFC